MWSMFPLLNSARNVATRFMIVSCLAYSSPLKMEAISSFLASFDFQRTFRTVSASPEIRTGYLWDVSFLAACHKPPGEHEKDGIRDVVCEGYIAVVFLGEWRVP
jgi:hypothetical protein